ncbi:MAG TPA: hypothetical protein VFU79_02330 [Nitrososphaeraceae archaeon]|nr:hypothetical protein [Nitrososphaeraceae archaeon]
MERNKIFSPVNHVLLMRFIFSITFFSLISLTIDYNILKDSSGQMLGGHGHNLPPSIVGDREIMLNFNDPQIDSAAENGLINFALVDNKTGNNIPHVTYIVSIYSQENKNIFTANLHGHNGEIQLEFHNKGIEGYNINANYDSLSASYVSDFGSPIKIDGSVFSDPGKYRVVTEITGIDFDNTFLPEPLKYEYNIDVK